MPKPSDTKPHDDARVFYCPSLAEGNALPREIELPPDEARHAGQVLRLRPGAPIRLFDGCGFFYDGEMLEVSRRSARVRVDGCACGEAESTIPLTLLIALAKGRKPDLVIQKSVELGVARIALFPSERSVVRADDAPPEGETRERYDHIVVAASKQCGRARLMDVRVYPGLADALASLEPGGARIAFWEKAAHDASTPPIAPGQPAAALIGPEGGLTPDEIVLAREAGFTPASLGPRILRAETAAIAAATLILGTAGELGDITPARSENPAP